MTPRITLFWQLCALATLAGVALTAALVPPPPRSRDPGEAEARPLFDAIVQEEPRERASALEDWAHHRWSQQDGFGALELERVTAVASERGITLQAAFRALDQGLRAGWPGRDGGPLSMETVPLKPRPMD